MLGEVKDFEGVNRWIAVWMMGPGHFNGSATLRPVARWGML